MITPDKQQKQAMERIARSNDGFIFIEYLDQCLQKQDENNRTSINEIMYRGQGKSLTLAELISMLNS